MNTLYLNYALFAHGGGFVDLVLQHATPLLGGGFF